MNAPSMRHYRSVFLSDFHIGAKSFDAAALVDFLQSVHCDYLYLVGDIIDGWKLNKRWHWTEHCSRVLDELVAKAAHGTKIIYIPGNHDDEVRHLSPLRRRRFEKELHLTLTDKIVHTLADGRKFLVLHGDQFDRKILRGPVSRWSDRLYDRLMDIFSSHGPAQIKIEGKIKPFSLAKALARHGKWALHLLNNFENAIHREATNRHVAGVICGHTHIPVIKNIRGITYANCGSWLRAGHTALTENAQGVLELVDWPNSLEQPFLFDPLYQHEPVAWKLTPDSSRYRATTLTIIEKIRRIWPVKTRRSAKPFNQATAGIAPATAEIQAILTRMTTVNVLEAAPAT
jgi:UDP-2,3-diacylglucosamine pyrophosphatase LpxH